jgi:hypothetical protein
MAKHKPPVQLITDEIKANPIVRNKANENPLDLSFMLSKKEFSEKAFINIGNKNSIIVAITTNITSF